MSGKVSQRQNIVIVGGGGAGAPIVNKLSAKLDPDKYNLILVTTRPYFTHLVASIRMLVTSEGNLEDRVLIPYDKNFVNGNGTLVVGKVASIADEGTNGGYITLENGERIDYSVLVLTPGSTWGGPLGMPNTKSETLQWLAEWRSRFEKSEDILLVGGGAVGIEYAGEIKEFWPEKKVTIIHGQKELLNDAYPEKWRKDVGRSIRRKGVQLILDDILPDSVDLSSEKKPITTRNGKSLRPDLIVHSRVGRPNTTFIGDSLGADVLTSSGHVKVLPTLQLASHPRIFSAGDVIDWCEQKQVAKYHAHAAVVSENVLAVINEQKPSKIYKGSYEMIVITMGKSGGSAYFGFLWGLVFGDWISALLKSKGLLVDITRKSLGQIN